MRRILLLIPLVLLVAQSASAAHYHLEADGSGAFPTIKAGIAAASSGDTLYCADGTYTGDGSSGLDFAGKNLVLRSESNHPKDCVISASFDRAFYFHSGETASAVVQGFTIRGGDADQGGGIYVTNAAPTFFNCVIRNCNAVEGAGAYLEAGNANPSFLNCVFALNHASNRGGGIFFHYSHGTVQNTTIVYNEADDAAGGGGFYTYGSDLDVRNCIIWGNWNLQVTNNTTGCYHNLIQGWVGGAENFDGSPDFTSGAGGDYYLVPATSDAVDAGEALASATCYASADGSQCMSRWVTRTDQHDDDGQVDVGYHHPHMTASLHVPSDHATIQAAIDAAWEGDLVQVADGTYTGDGNRDLVTRGKQVTVRSQSGDAAACVIDCQGSLATPHRGFYIHEGEGTATRLEHLTVVNGWTSGYGGGLNVFAASPTVHGCVFSGNHAGIDGGGVMCQAGNAVFDGCTFSGNSAGDAGGGMLTHTCAPVLTNCLFQSNSAGYGGGMHNYVASPTLTGCTFRFNTCANSGGGMHNDGAASAPILTGCVFDENQAANGGGMYSRNGARPTATDCQFNGNATTSGGRGGGVYSIGSTLTATRCVFGGNEAAVDGGGLYARSSSQATLDSCVFVSNQSGSGGAGIYFYDHDTSTLRNCTFDQGETANGGGIWTWLDCATTVTRCIVWDNRASTAGLSIGIDGGCTMTVTCSDVAGGQAGVHVGGGSTLTWGSGNIDANPLFCGAGPGGLGLDAASPCAPAHSGGCGLIGARPVSCANVGVEPGAAVTDRLHAPAPNPFGLGTRVAFELRERSAVTLRVYDVAGRLVRTLAQGTYEPGPHKVTWDGRDDRGRTVARGAYYCRLATDRMNDVVKVVFIH